MKRLEIFPFLWLIITLFPTSGFGQLLHEDVEFRIMTIGELMNSIINSSEKTVYINNVEVVLDQNRYSRFPKNDNYSNAKIDSLIETFEPIIIDKEVRMFNVHFKDPITFAKLHFKKLFHYEFIEGFSNQKWTQCRFDDLFNGHALSSFAFIFDRCHFNQFHTETFSVSHAYFDNCTFTHQLSIVNGDHLLMQFNRCQFAGNSIFRMSGTSDLEFKGCTFNPTNSNDNILFYDGTILNSLTLENDTFNAPIIFQQASIKESFREENCYFSSYLDLHNLNLPENNTQLRWPSINNSKLKVFQNDTIFGSNDAISEESESMYYALLKSYAQLQRVYKNNGDRASYNASYVEMRDMESKKFKMDFLSNPSLKTFFEWRLNLFLKRYCNYGTSPVKALLYSFLVIEIFAILFFFFPSGTNRVRVRAMFRERKNKNIDEKTFMGLLKRLFIQLVDAMATSMNAFVTLGYGSMPVIGIGKYLAVLEGLIGWFLLSIFSVSLISQILQ